MPIAHALYAPLDPYRPEPTGICDRCGFLYPLAGLVEQRRWAGAATIGTGVRVCTRTCLDELQENGLRTSIAGLTSYTLTVANDQPDQARRAMLAFTGALAADCTVTIPAVARIGWVTNGTSGGFNVILTTGGGTNLTVPTATSYLYTCDGVNITAVPLVVSTSDRRLKTGIEDITPAEGALWVQRGRPRTFIVAGRAASGFIAQEDIAAGRGAAVSSVTDGSPVFAESDGVAAAGRRLVRDYQHDIAYLTAALQDALARIATLEDAAERASSHAAR